jgi:hypothetical protein
VIEFERGCGAQPRLKPERAARPGAEGWWADTIGEADPPAISVASDEIEPRQSPGGVGAKPPSQTGAGDGNRTHVTGLGSQRSTIELHPRAMGESLPMAGRQQARPAGMWDMVGATGFEPATFASRTQRSSQAELRSVDRFNAAGVPAVEGATYRRALRGQCVVVRRVRNATRLRSASETWWSSQSVKCTVCLRCTGRPERKVSRMRCMSLITP